MNVHQNQKGRMKTTTIDKPLIVARKVTRIYELGVGEVIGIDSIDFDILAGELVVLKGNSGSGKSTLLALLAGLDQPTHGQLMVAGQDLKRATAGQLTHYRRRVVGMVFQSFNLLPTLTVMENICLPALLAGEPFDRVRSSALRLLDWLNLTHRQQHQPAQLSGGEMQRAAIARALINDPAIILADEPTGNLDSQNGQAVIELLVTLNRRSGRTVIIATHSMLADAYATMEIRLQDGRIVT
jgi:putative ABC transport system ATP-binding protein